MGTDHNETGGRRAPQKAQKSAVIDFWTWHPTEAEKKQFGLFIEEAEELGSYLDTITKAGIGLTLTRAKTGDSLCVVARSRFDSFGEGQALSVFHSDPLRAVWGMIYVLSVLHPRWPAERVTVRQLHANW